MSRAPRGSADANSTVLPPLKRPISAIVEPSGTPRASRKSSAASSTCSVAMPWFSRFDENSIARSWKPSIEDGKVVTLSHWARRGSRNTIAWTAWWPDNVWPARCRPA